MKYCTTLLPKVEYSMTPLGRSTVPIIEHLRGWGEHFRSQAGEE